jgi:hypothetical protein
LRWDLKTSAGYNAATPNCQKQVGGQNVDELGGVAPLVRVGESLGKDVASLSVSFLIEQCDLVSCKLLMQPINRHAVSAAKMAHCGVSARLADPDHGLVVFMDKQRDGPGGENVPQVKAGETNRPKGGIGGHNFGLWSGVRNASLPLAEATQRKASVRPPQAQVGTGSRPGRVRASRKVGIGEKVGRQIVD